MSLTGAVGQLPLANLIISVSAETKAAMTQMQNLQTQTKKADKKVNAKTGILGVALRGIIVAGAAIAVIVAGIGIAAVGAWGLFKASTYYGMYSKMWASEATMISNEWVRRNMSVFDNLTKTIEQIRIAYTKNKDCTIPGAIAKVLLGNLAGTQSMGSAVITKSKGFLTTISQNINWAIGYIQLWVNNFVKPIYDFVDLISSTLNNIYTTIKNFIDAVWAALSKLPGID